MSHILVIADHFDGTLSPATAKTVACAAMLNGPGIDVLVPGHNTSALAEQAARLHGVDCVYRLEAPTLAHRLAVAVAPAIEAFLATRDYTHVLSANTGTGRDLLPRLSARLGLEMITDLMAVVDDHCFERPIYAGNAVTRVQVEPGQRVLATVRTASFAPVADDGQARIESVAVDIEVPTHTRFESLDNHAGDRRDLATSARVVTGGRGLGSEENFQLIHAFAERIGAAVGASRAAVDAGYVPNDMQVGQTGKIIAPDLYICFGISGAIQHLAGIKDAGTIVAVNTDPDAPIFDMADIGLVGDLFEVIPALEKALTGAA